VLDKKFSTNVAKYFNKMYSLTSAQKQII